MCSRNNLAVVLGLALVAGCQTVPVINVPRTTAPPDDAAWQRAATITGLCPPIVTNNVVPPAPQPTTVRLLWDPQFLYVAFDCADTNITFTANRKHDDDLYREDVVEVFLDGFGNGRQFVEIQVNPAGVNLDLLYLFTGTPQFTPQHRLTQEYCATDRWGFREWDMKDLRTTAQRTPTGWRAVLAIPAAVIMKRRGHTEFFPTEIRANFVRYDWVAGQLIQQSWSPVLHGCPHISPTLMGRLRLQ